MTDEKRYKKERHKKLLAMRDEDIDYSDIPELSDDKPLMPRPNKRPLGLASGLGHVPGDFNDPLPDEDPT